MIISAQIETSEGNMESRLSWGDDGNARLPLDILWMVISELCDGDASARKTLRTCRLLNRNTSAIATPLLFRTLTLHAGLENSTNQMNNLLESSLELLQHVRVIKIPWTSAVPYYHIHGLGLGRPREDLAVNWTMEVLETHSTRLKRDISAFEAAAWNLFNACKDRLEEIMVDAAIPNVDTKVRHCEKMRLNMSSRLSQPFREALAGLSLPSLKAFSITVNDVTSMPELRPSSSDESEKRFDRNIMQVERLELRFRKVVDDLNVSRGPLGTYRRTASWDELDRLRLYTFQPMDNLKELVIVADYQFRDLAKFIVPTAQQKIRKLSLGSLRLDKCAQVVDMLRNLRLYLEDFEMWDTTIKQDISGGAYNPSLHDPWKAVFGTLEVFCLQLVRVRFDQLTDLTFDINDDDPRCTIRSSRSYGFNGDEKRGRMSSVRDLYMSEEEYAAFDGLRAVITKRRGERGLEREEWMDQWGAWWYRRMRLQKTLSSIKGVEVEQ